MRCMQYRVISFYRYVRIEQPEEMRDSIRTYCEEHSILGRILIATEGINGAVSGTDEEIRAFQHYLAENPLFAQLTFREQVADVNTYHKLVVRVRSEIVRFGVPVRFEKPGTHLSPVELEKWYSTSEDFVIIDGRNEYEYEVGRFKNAVKLPIENFREFAGMTNELEKYKTKKMVLYCTGGIRCEKASAYLKEQGFPQVYQVEGGVINYVNQFPNAHWEGGLFVFDDRLVSDVGETITQCGLCGVAEKQYMNCHNLDCDELFICCEKCCEKMKRCCSDECMQSPRQRKVIEMKKYVQIGVIENYYAKANVALVKMNLSAVSFPLKVMIKGKTTAEFEYEIQYAHNAEGKEITRASEGEIITFPLSQKVRRHDVVLLASI